MGQYELMDHTADMGIRIRGDSLADLFNTGAKALFELICSSDSIELRQWMNVELTAPDLESLLIYWLNELIFLHETQAMVFRTSEVRIRGRTGLKARVGGEALRPSTHHILRNIKAATYHQLKVMRTPNGWIAQVVLDV